MKKVLLTGATGYIGKRLLPVLIKQGYFVICCVRDSSKFNPEQSIKDKIKVIELDLTKPLSLEIIPTEIDFAFYLVHSMSNSKDYQELEKLSAKNFSRRLNQTNAKQLIYLSGITNNHTLSKHLKSRKNVELELSKGNYALTTVRAGIIIGSGSASFEIIRDLVEKLPIMIAPKWLKTRCQPIGIADVITILTKLIDKKVSFNKAYDIAGKEILTYKQMLLQFANARGLRRYIFTVPVMTPKLSSYWLYFITSTSFKLACSLVDSMKVEVIAKEGNINKLLNLQTLSYKENISRAFKKIEQNEILSSWKDSTISGRINFKISDYINVPNFGCFKDFRQKEISNTQKCIENIWAIGGKNGWYYGNWLWKIRGYLDKLVGGVGLRRGRTNQISINAGDSLDFWRVLYANKEEGRLLLFAEMKLPGEAWLEFKIEKNILKQTATFRPKGILGRLYWYAVFPLHSIIFQGMISKLIK